VRPFFSYYGAKYTGAKHYGAPRSDLVIEPFAGSACYSTRWAPRHAHLYDVSLDVCDLWAFLIGCSERDIQNIPDYFESFDQVASLSRGANLLVRFWISKGRAEPSGTLSPWYHQYANTNDCRVWGPAVKRRIMSQKPNITRWSIDCMSWDSIPDQDAHWHVDPPYNNSAGSRYPQSDVDYTALSEWCQNLQGNVDVCENVGATWMPFEPLYNVVTSRGRRTGSVSSEAVWRKIEMPRPR